MEHHELVGQLGADLRLGHFLVEERVADGDAAVDAEGRGDLLIEAGEVEPRGLVAELRHADHLSVLLDREA